MRKRRLEEIYNSYAANVLPRQAGAVQRRETRQAFFAGAFSMFDVLRTAAVDSAMEIEVVDDLHEEMSAFTEATAKAAGRS
jgi:hypothetical protein